jgi:hypothetical protein
MTGVLGHRLPQKWEVTAACVGESCFHVPPQSPKQPPAPSPVLSSAAMASSDNLNSELRTFKLRRIVNALDKLRGVGTSVITLVRAACRGGAQVATWCAAPGC